MSARAAPLAFCCWGGEASRLTGADNLDWLEEGPAAYDLVLSADGAPAKLEPYVRQGGRLLVAGEAPAGFGLPEPVRRWEDTRSAYFRIHDHEVFPSFAQTHLLFLDGEYLESFQKGRRC